MCLFGCIQSTNRRLSGYVFCTQYSKNKKMPTMKLNDNLNHCLCKNGVLEDAECGGNEEAKGACEWTMVLEQKGHGCRL
jgi:hypothetical protein